MRPWWLVGALLGSLLGATEHQRVAATAPESSVQAAIGWSLAPGADAAAWNRVGWDWGSGDFSTTWAWPFDPAASEYALGLRLVEGARTWRAAAGWAVERWSAGFGVSSISDPLVVSADVRWSAGPLPSLGLVLACTEVVNEQATWSLGVSPRLVWIEGVALWSLGVTWQVGWDTGAWNLTNGVSLSGGGLAWSGEAAARWTFSAL